MHRFNRGDSPVNFKQIARKCKDWDKIDQGDRRTIRDALYDRQQKYCAYCECPIESADKERAHIEHLERRKDVPQKTFDWNNLFLSCTRPKSCGKYKDDPKNGIKFNVADVIDPSKENPLDYYAFAKDGRIVPRSDENATPERKRKVEETVRIFNLNCSKLLEIRKNALRNIDCLFIQLGRSPSKKEIEKFLNNLGEKNLCISVYYDYFGFRSEYEERFAPNR